MLRWVVAVSNNTETCEIVLVVEVHVGQNMKQIHNVHVPTIVLSKTTCHVRDTYTCVALQSLQRLVSQFSTKREIKAPPTVAGMDRMDNRYPSYPQAICSTYVAKVWKSIV